MNMRKIRAVFYIYSEASLAVFLLVAAALELACGFGLGGPFRTIGACAAGFFVAVALAYAAFITIDCRKYRSCR